MKVTSNGLEGIAEFDDEDPLAIRYWNLYRKKRMRAVSVGFIAISWRMDEREISGQKQRVRVFTKVELIEISAVAIPACRTALARVASFAPAPGTSLAAATLTANDATDDDAIAALEKRLGSLIERTLTRLLDARPGSLNAELFKDIAQLTHGSGGLWSEDDDDARHADDTPDRRDESEGEHDAIKTALRDAITMTPSKT